jgi:putative peptidoglycan lipid II flippase
MKINFKSIALVAGLTLFTSLLGFVREMFFARSFGTSMQADAFITAFSIVSTGFLIFTAGTLQSAFMPRYQSLLSLDGGFRATSLLRTTLFRLFIILLLLTAATIIFSSQIVNFIAPGFDPARKALTSTLVKIMAPAIVLMGSGNILQCILHAHQRFISPAIVPSLNNLIIILFLAIAAMKFGITGLGVAILIGSGLWWVFLLPFAWKYFASKDPVKPVGNDFKVIMLNFLPLLLLLVSDQICALVQKGLVSGLGVGYISALNYASRLSGLPIGIFSMAVVTVFFPALVNAMSSGNKQLIKEQCLSGISVITLFLLPITFFMFFNAKSLVSLAFQRGSFDQHSVAITASALSWYVLGLIPQSLLVFLNRIYYSVERMKTPMAIGVFSAAMFIVICVLLVHKVGYLGIAIGTSLYALIYALLLLLFIKWSC